jgi:SOS-response transcriptional repressor LexA
MYNDVPEDKLSDVSIHAGFPNPATDTDRQSSGLSLDQLLVKHPSSTYMFRLSGHAWVSEGIDDGDIAIVDRAYRVLPNDLVIAWNNEEFFLVRARRLPEHVVPWGVVTSVIHHYRQEGV